MSTARESEALSMSREASEVYIESLPAHGDRVLLDGARTIVL